VGEILTVDSVQKQRSELLEKLRKQVKEFATREIKRLEDYASWLEKLNRAGVNAAGQVAKQTDQIILLNELDDLLGRQ